jgi:hypothetical protein
VSAAIPEPTTDFECPRCARRLQIARSHEGRKVICPGCEAQVAVPRPEAPPCGATPLDPPSQAADPLSGAWYCSINGRQYGPMSTASLLAEIRSGRFSPILPVWRSGMPDWALAAQVPQLRQAGLPPAPLPAPEAARPPVRHELPWAPAWLVVALHYLTLGVFSVVWFALMHGRMPRIRGDDPSAARAVGFLLIPVFNVYWLFFVHLRLCERLNDLRVQRGLMPNVPEPLAIFMCVLAVVPPLGALSWLIVAPVFYGIAQAKVNELIERG